MTSERPEHLRRAHVVGLGLIGSSLAAGLRARGWWVSGEDENEARAALARSLGVVDELGDGTSAVLGIVATPVAEIAKVARRLLDAGLAVTDVGGVKSGIVQAVESERFIGGHPMAGSEQDGPEAADGDLFVGATWVLTPSGKTDPEVFGFVQDVVTSLGAEVVALAADRHDELVALVSHLPHLAAANLMSLAADAAVEHAALLRLAAGGFRDMTRVAAGDPTIWPDIFADNAPAILVVLDELIARLAAARTQIATGDRSGLTATLDRARTARRNLPPRVVAPDELVELRVPVLDRPGVLAEVTTVLGESGVNVFDLEIAHSAEGVAGVLVLAIDGASAEVARRALLARGYRPSLSRIS